MDFDIGRQVTLGGNTYQIKKILGSGALADAYLAVPSIAPGFEVVIKVLRNGLDVNTPETKNLMNGLRNEIKVLQILNNDEDPAWGDYHGLKSRLERSNTTKGWRHVIALLDYGEIDVQQIFQIQEKAPSAIEMADFEIKSIHDELRLFGVMNAVLDVLALAHNNGFSLKDFEPNTKWDRLRLTWLDDSHEGFELKVIDWNVTGEHDGFSQDLLYFGGHLFRLLFKHNIVFEGKDRNIPPRNLGSLVRDRGGVTEGSRQVMQKLLQRDANRRYQRVDDLRMDFKWWFDILKEAQSPDALYILQDHLWDFKRQENFGRVLSVADLALRALPSVESRDTFQSWVGQARQELEKQEVLPIAHARGTLLTGSFEKAAAEFERELFNLSPESEAARQTDVYIALARAGEQMKKAQDGADIRNSPEWLSLEHGAKELIKQNPEMALMAFSEVSNTMPQAVEWTWFKALNGKANAIKIYKKASDDLFGMEQIGVGMASENWLRDEKAQIAIVEKIIEQIREAQQLDPKNMEIRLRYQDEQTRLEWRRARLQEYQAIENNVKDGQEIWKKVCEQMSPDELSESKSLSDLEAFQENSTPALKLFQNAFDTCEKILNEDPLQERAVYWKGQLGLLLGTVRNAQNRVTNRAGYLEVVKNKKTRLERLAGEGKYIAARDELSQIRQRYGVIPELQSLETEIVFAANIENELRNKLNLVRSDYMGNLQAVYVEKLVRDINDSNKIQLSTPERRFVLSSEINESMSEILHDLDKLKELENRKKMLESEPARDNDRAMFAVLRDVQDLLQSHGVPLSGSLQKQFDDIQARLEKYDRLYSKLGLSFGFDVLDEMAGELKNDHSHTAQELRSQIATEWRNHVSGLNDLDDVKEKLARGAEIFPERKDFKEDKRKAEDLLAIRADLNLGEGNSHPAWIENNNGRLARHSQFLEILRDKEHSDPFFRRNADMLWGQLRDQYEKFVKDRLSAFTEEVKHRGGMESTLTGFYAWKTALQPRLLSDDLKNSLQQVADMLERYKKVKQDVLSGKLWQLFSHEADELIEHPNKSPEVFLGYHLLILGYQMGSGDVSLDNLLSQKVKDWYTSAGQGIKISLSDMHDEQRLNNTIELFDNFFVILKGLQREASKYKDGYQELLPDSSQYENWFELLQKLSEFRQNKIQLSPASTSKVKKDLLSIKNVFSGLISIGIDSKLKECSALLDKVLLPMTTLLLDVYVSIDDKRFLESLLNLELKGRVFANILRDNSSSLWLMGNYQNFLKKEFQDALDMCMENLQIQALGYLSGDANTASEKLKQDMLLPCGGEAVNGDVRVVVRDAIIKAGEDSSVISRGENRKSVVDKGRAKRIWNAIAKSSEGLDIQEWDVLHQTALEQVKSLSGLDPKWRTGLVVAGVIGMVIVALAMYSSYAMVSSRNIAAAVEHGQFTQTSVMQTAIAMAEGTMQQTFVVGTKTAQMAAAVAAQATLDYSGTQTQAALMCEFPSSYSMKVFPELPFLFPPAGSTISTKDNLQVSASWGVQNTSKCDWPVAKLRLISQSSKYKELQLIWTPAKQTEQIVVKVSPDGVVTAVRGTNKLDPKDAESLSIPIGQGITLIIVLSAREAATNMDGSFFAKGYWQFTLDKQIVIGQLNLTVPPNKDRWISWLSSVQANTIVPLDTLIKTATPTDTVTPTSTPALTASPITTKTPRPPDIYLPLEE